MRVGIGENATLRADALTVFKDGGVRLPSGSPVGIALAATIGVGVGKLPPNEVVNVMSSSLPTKGAAVPQAP